MEEVLLLLHADSKTVPLLVVPLNILASTTPNVPKRRTRRMSTRCSTSVPIKWHVLSMICTTITLHVVTLTTATIQKIWSATNPIPLKIQPSPSVNQERSVPSTRMKTNNGSLAVPLLPIVWTICTMPHAVTPMDVTILPPYWNATRAPMKTLPL